MPVVAVVNPKGGSGKSTLATHLAAHAARLGLSVMLGDVDRQKSTQVWLRRRAKLPDTRHAPIVSWVADANKVLRPRPGVTHVVLDTPAGLQGFDRVRVLMSADAVLIPVCDSAFDREAVAEFWAELRRHPRVTSGRCQVAAVGMRIDTRTRAADGLRAWAGRIELPFLGVLRDTQLYVRCIDRGLTIFDMPPTRSQPDREQWTAILDWLDPLWTSRDASITPSQADVLEVPPAAGAAVRVAPQRRPTAQLRELAAALAPQERAPRPALLRTLFGWLPALRW